MQNNTIIPLYYTANPLVRPTREKTFVECWNELTELQYDFSRLKINYVVNIASNIQDLLLEKDQLDDEIFLSSITSLIWKLRNYLTVLVSHGEIEAAFLNRVSDLNLALNVALGDQLTR